jgi:diacylglycerol kinase family enzyme
LAGFLIVNPRAGAGRTEAVVAAARARGIDCRVLDDGEDPAEVARAARAEVLGVAGGDGSLAPVAAVAAERGLPFVCVPAGTRNHFARDVGLDRDDPEGALEAFHGGSERLVDLAFASGRPFLNNLSLGLYATLVHRRERHRRRRNAFARLRALAIVASHRPQRLSVDGDPVDAHVLVVANNAYRLDMLSLGEREQLDGGLLHLYAASGLLPGAWDERCAPAFVVDSSRGSIDAAVDGEPARLRTPVEVRIAPRALRLLLPARIRGDATEEEDVENPKPTETEQELQGTERHSDEDDMRGVGQDDELPLDDDDEQ